MTSLFAAVLLLPGIIPMPDATYDYAPVDGRSAPGLYADPRFLAALDACGAPPPGYGIFNTPANRAVKCMDSRGYILVESFKPPRQ